MNEFNQQQSEWEYNMDENTEVATFEDEQGVVEEGVDVDL
jgi:hypothetical protein